MCPFTKINQIKTVPQSWVESLFLSWGQRGGKQKGTGGRRPELVQSVWTLPQLGPPRTSVLMNTFFASFPSTPFHRRSIKSLTGFTEIPVLCTTLNSSNIILKLRVGISSWVEETKIFWPHSAEWEKLPNWTATLTLILTLIWWRSDTVVLPLNRQSKNGIPVQNHNNIILRESQGTGQVAPVPPDRLQKDPLCVQWDIKPCLLTDSEF